MWTDYNLQLKVGIGDFVLVYLKHKIKKKIVGRPHCCGVSVITINL